MEFHHLLNKQIKKTLPEQYLQDEVVLRFLESVSNSYNSFEKAKKISEHAFTISEREYQEVNTNLLKENEVRQQSISEIKKAILSLAPDSIAMDDQPGDNLINIIKYLQEQISKAKELENQLIHAKDAAENATVAKSHFLSAMSHEIRTPMNAVIGFTNLLLQLEPRADQMEYLSMLKFSAENLLVLINDILDFSKIEEGKIEIEETDFSVKDLTNNIRLALLPKAIEKNIQLKLLMDADLPDNLIGDPVRLGQILTNLVSNAVKFTKAGRVIISVSLNTRLEDYTSIDFEVADTGIGIENEKLEYIFESFTQASSDITRKFGGTGLGLAITKRLLQLMSSDISVKSEPGKGSTFCFSLKLKNSLKKSGTPFQQAQADDRNLQGVRVLIAEDNKINVVLARQYMKLWGVVCDVADNGRVAFDMVQHNDYDLVLMDLQMPEMDGYQATEVIRSLPEAKYKKLPIIALTASATVDIKDIAFASGMNDYVTKPFNPKELNFKIKTHALKFADGITVRA
jgi:signal transduction histidine kinase/ActR/RegA family two-component response regulator